MTALMFPLLLGLPTLSTRTMLIVAAIIAVLFALGAFAASRTAGKARVATGYDRAFGWIDRAITAWHEDGRLSDAEAERLRAELREPEFVAVLPHFGVHLAIGVVLRFPIGSITRAAYVAANIALAHVRFATRRIDARTLRSQMGIHSPLVLLITAIPGIGTFAYLASKPFRSHHLLVRVALDAVLLRLPKRVYERTGLRTAIARPSAAQRAAEAQDGRASLRVRLVPARVMWPLALIALALFAVDLAMLGIDRLMEPDFLGWEPLFRLLDLNSEASFGTWLAVLLLAVIAGLLGIIALDAHARGDRFARHWTVLAILALGMSIDEGAKIHDLGNGFGTEMRERLGLGGILYYGWVLIALATVVILALLYRRFVFALPPGTRNLLVIAAAAYVGGEVGMEMISGWLMDTRGDGMAYAVVTAFEEGSSLLGVVIAVGTLLRYIGATAGTISVQVTRPVAAPGPTAKPLAAPAPVARPVARRTIPRHVATATMQRTDRT